MEKKSANGRDTGVIEGFICGVVTGFCLPNPQKKGPRIIIRRLEGPYDIYRA